MEPSESMDWAELGRRVTSVRELLQEHKVPLVPGEGLHDALDEADRVANSIKANSLPTTQAFLSSARAASSVWALFDTLQTCFSHGLPLKNHLKQMTTGSVDYGIPAGGNEPKKIYFKDFEFELFIAAQCLKKGYTVLLNENPNDPEGDLFVDGLRVEVKHPNSIGQLKKLIRKFNGLLEVADKHGVFVVGLEDAFGMGSMTPFSAPVQAFTWLETKRRDMEVFGMDFLQTALALRRIMVTAQVASFPLVVGNAFNIHRQANSMIFDTRILPTDDEYAAAKRVAEVFNPYPPRWKEALGPG